MGQFRLLGAPDHFVWLRAFDDMQTRRQGLEGFYTSEFWLQRRPTTNSMILDNDDVHLLRPLLDMDLLYGNDAQQVAADMAAGTISPAVGVIAIDFYHAQQGQHEAMFEVFQSQIVPAYEQQGVQLRGVFGAEMGENTYPRLPVIQDDNELVVFTAYASEDDAHDQRATLAPHVDTALAGYLQRPTETLLLQPTLRSPLRYMPKG